MLCSGLCSILSLYLITRIGNWYLHENFDAFTQWVFIGFCWKLYKMTRQRCLNVCVSTNHMHEKMRQIYQSLKVHKHEIILNFFWPKSNPYMPFVNFRKKFRFFSFDFRQIFFERYPKIFLVKILTLVLLGGFLDDFSKFWFFIGEICILIRDF